MTALFLFFCSLSWADAPAPYYPRDFNSNNPMGAYNQNLSDITNRNRDNLVPIVKDNACADSEVLFGPTQKGGFLFGGRCASPATASGSTVSVTSPLSGDGSSGSPVALTGAVPIAQISLATVTTALAGKLSNTAAVPTALLDFSTITSALTGKANTFTGISSACASGFVLTTGTWSNGVLTGGWCEAQSGSGGGSATGTAPTRQVFLSGSGTYTTPANVSQIRVRMVAQGGGGGAAATNNGVVGSSSTWISLDGSTISSIGGSPGLATTAEPGGTGGAGGSGGNNVWASSSVFHYTGNGGGAGIVGSGVGLGGFGGGSAFGGGGAAMTGQGVGVNNGATNTGGGGSGGSSGSGNGSGGGGGESAEIIISNPAARYFYTVGSIGGAGGAAGSQAGGNGGSGIIIVDEYYSVVAPVSGTLGFVVDNFLGQVNGSKTAYTLSQVPASSSTLMVVLDGLMQSGASDYAYSAGIVTMTTSPASNSSSFYVQYAVNTSTFGAVGTPTTFASTITIASGANAWVMLSSFDVTGATFTPTIYFTGVSVSSRECRVDMISLSTGAFYPVFVFNGDFGAKYTYAGSEMGAGGGHFGAQFSNSIAAPVYMQHSGASAQNITANTRFSASIYFRTGTTPTTTDFSDEFLGDTNWHPGFIGRHFVTGRYSGGPATSMSLAQSHANAIDVTGAVTATDSFYGLHMEAWCKGFNFR